MSMSQLIIQGVKVFDGEHFISGPQDVIFSDGLVSKVVPTGTESYDAAAQIVPGHGKTLTPGFIDCHVHIAIANAAEMTNVNNPFSYRFYQAIGHLRDTLAIGITTARDAGYADAGVKKAVADGLIPGPRLKIAISIMSQTGGHGDAFCPSGADLGVPHPGKPYSVADGVEEVRKVTRQLLRAGADQIKICTTGGVLSPADDPRHSQFSVEEIKVIVAEAQAQGKYVMSHAQGTQGIKNALIAGVRSIEHGIYLDDEAIQMMLDAGTYLVPTLIAPLAVIRAADAGAAFAPNVIAKAHLVAQTHHESIARAIAAGVKIAMGTDSGVGAHGTNLEELWLMYNCGLSLEGVLAATTKTAGELVAPDEKIGCLRPGFLGDAVLLDFDLNDGAQLETLKDHIVAVFQDGRQVV
jgi:imidazolonepropionase-like amidohydrolase